MVEIDRFKTINDTYGHPSGDAVLRTLTDCLVRNFPRRSDLVARYGGEELAVVLPAGSTHDAKRLAECLLVAIRALQVRYGDQVITVTASVGVDQLGSAESIQSWLELTDQALYCAKSDGRDTVVVAVAAD